MVEQDQRRAGKVRLNYLVDAAAWRPQYKIRAGKQAKDPVQVEYLAAITQQSGEDWQGVEPRTVHGRADAQRHAARAEDAGRQGGAAQPPSPPTNRRACRRSPAREWA